MKQFFTNIAANLATVALLFLLVIMLTIGIVAAAAGGSDGVVVPDGAVLVVDLSDALADRAPERTPTSSWDRALTEPGGTRIALRAAVVALQEAATDDRISSVLLRGNVMSDGLSSGYGGLVEFREALVAFAASGKPVHAFLLDPTVRDYYIASAASTITLDPFGALQFGGLSSTQFYFAGLLEKYGIGMQVSRVGRFKSAVEPFLRSDMSPESRAQTRRYLEATWHEIKRQIALSRSIDTLRLQQLADSVALFLPDEAVAMGLADRVAHFDVLLDDLRRITSKTSTGADDQTVDEVDEPATELAADSLNTNAVGTGTALPTTIPQVLLRDYARIAIATTDNPTARRRIAVVYAQGDIVNGEGGTNQIGGAAFARELRALRHDDAVRAVVLRVNSPGGSVTASEEIRRELILLNADKPVVVSMGTLAASGGYWIATAARRVYAQPSTLTGSIGVFAVFPNLEQLAEKNGITMDTVNTARYADIYSVSRPRTTAELAIVQRSIDVVYEAFLERVATSRSLPLDSVRTIAEGRVWSGEDALAIGLVDELGGLQVAIGHAAELAGLDGDYALRELPKQKGASEMFQEFFNDSPPPVIGSLSAMLSATSVAQSAGISPQALSAWTGRLGQHGPVSDAVRMLTRDLGSLLAFDDPRGTYARLPFALQIR